MNKHPIPVIDIVDPPHGAIPATINQLRALGVTDVEIDAGEKHFERHIGPWNLCSSIRGVVADCDDNQDSRREQFYPPRVAYDLKSCGYHAEGRISFGGRKRRVFTSSRLFELPDGRLVDVAILHLFAPTNTITNTQ